MGEEGVINETLRGPLAELFDSHQMIHDVSGAGNNWAHGYCVYGEQYKDQILESVRVSTEQCDSLQCFQILHSLGGGTGSGLGTYLLELLHDHYPHIYRFVTAVFPSADDDVITSPYNSVLSLRQLMEFADCVLPMDNQALIDISSLTQKLYTPPSSSSSSSTSMAVSSATTAAAISGAPAAMANLIGRSGSVAPTESKDKETRVAAIGSRKSKPFDQMNTIAAHLLTNLTCSMRFEGTLNVDLNEITMNLVPFPRLHFLVSSLSPLPALTVQQQALLKRQQRAFGVSFSNLFHRDYQLLKVDPKHSMYLACGILSRGDVLLSDLNRQLAKIKSELEMVFWNVDGFKVGHCGVPAVGHSYNMLSLSNNCCIKDVFAEIGQRFSKLYKRKAHVHHYTQYMELDRFDLASAALFDLIDDYDNLQRQQLDPPAPSPRTPLPI
eukprot:TRINITY_DN5074_c0_g1_i1.p1 TRINITY_DN5074_c0_g1~~TRINITY_DN5074_c0_g1_i1.p1  ORF type:complete len:449 (+),score=105.99 TRINITY_DN5074_c0_g1_i1:32-1348(+)